MGYDYENWQQVHQEFIEHFLSYAGNVVTTWSCAFDKSQ